MVNLTHKQINILILDDNSFYHKLIKAQLNKCFETYGLTNNIQFKLNCYTHVEDLLLNMNEVHDVAFVDYFLGNGYTGATVVSEIKKFNPHCQIAIMSVHDAAENRLQGVNDSVKTFIPKDRKALGEICQFVNSITQEKYPEII